MTTKYTKNQLTVLDAVENNNGIIPPDVASKCQAAINKLLACGELSVMDGVYVIKNGGYERANKSPVNTLNTDYRVFFFQKKEDHNGFLILKDMESKGYDLSRISKVGLIEVLELHEPSSVTRGELTEHEGQFSDWTEQPIKVSIKNTLDIGGFCIPPMEFEWIERIKTNGYEYKNPTSQRPAKFRFWGSDD